MSIAFIIINSELENIAINELMYAHNYFYRRALTMGERGEVFSSKLIKNDRTYFFNVKENVFGDLYLNVVESRPTEVEGRFLRQSIIVYQEDLGEFVKEFEKSLDYIKMNGTKKRNR